MDRRVISSAHFLAMAIFSNGAWVRFLWALGISIIAKWLARGFDDSEKRVAFEAKLVAEGYSPEEAGRIWLQQYLGSGKEQTRSSDIELIIRELHASNAKG